MKTNEFQKFWSQNYSLESIIKKSDKGIRFVIGFLKDGGGSEVQSVIFDKDKWDKDTATAWLKDNDFKNPGVDETENSLRYRQEEPGKYQRMRTIIPGEKAEKYGGHYDTQEGGNAGNDDSSENRKPKTKKGIDLTKSLPETGGAPFKIYIEKASVMEEGKMQTVIVKDIDGNVVSEEQLPEHMIVEGLASTTNVDHDQERMAPEALKAMVDCINEKGVPLISEHSKNWDGYLGRVFKAWFDERNQMHIRAELDRDMSKSVDLYKALKKGAQLGLSIAGVVKRAGLEMAEALGKKVKTFYDVLIKEVSVTNRPSNFDTWLVAKRNLKRENGLYEKFFGTDVYEEYLKSNPTLDWRYAIAKSVSSDSLNDTSGELNSKTQKNFMNKKLKKSIEEVNKAFAAFQEACKAMDNDTTSEDTKTEDTKTDTTVETKTEDTSQYEADTSTDDTKDKTTKDDTTTTEEADKKKAVGDKKDSSADSSTETDTTKSQKEAVEKAKKEEAEKFAIEKKALVDSMVKELEKRFADQNKRIIGPLREMVEKFMSEPEKRKGIATGQNYKPIEKKFSGDADTEVDNELEKDLKDDKQDFKSVFKKHYGSVRE